MSTETLRPNAAGSETSITSQYPATGSHYDKVDDVTPDDGATYVAHYAADGSYARDLYNLPAHSGSGTINSITIYFRHYHAVYGPYYAKPSLRTHSTTYDGNEIYSIPTWTTSSQMWITNPYTGSAWTWTEIDDLQIGVSLKSAYGYTYCTQVYVVIDYGGGTLYGTAVLGGVGSLLAIGRKEARGESLLTGIGTLTAYGGAEGLLYGTALLEGVGNLIASGRKDVRVTASLIGTGTLTASVALARKIIALTVSLRSRAISVYLPIRDLTMRLIRKR
jgi:hypothetical protein